MAKRTSQRTSRRAAGKRPKASGSWRRRIRWAVLLSLLFTLPVAGLYGLWLHHRVTTEFEGKRWALPARVYARPLELYQGMNLRPENLEAELQALNYRQASGGRQPGTYQRSGDRFTLTSRAFQFPDGLEPARTVQVQFAGKQVLALHGEGVVDLVRLDPALIGSIYPAHQEDRILVRLDEVPPLLIDALLALEDKEFFQHKGISFSGVGRALYANMRAGRVVQGGSTLTQQLVKNFFLSNERTITRKVNEAVMSLLLEARYSKEEILEAYLNEVYLGQDGQRAVHGFGMAAEHYFSRPLHELSPHQLALLAAIVRGPSYYDPRRHPQRARARRDHVLNLLAGQGRLDSATAHAARSRALEVVPRGRSGDSLYPAFMELVKLHLQRDYRPQDLSSEGLRIFSTLAPAVQERAEEALARRLRQWRDSKLEGAVVMLDVDDGSVLALIGGRDPRFAGFNRALAARRQVGSLIKPAVYLAALERPGQYGLGTPLADEPISLRSAKGEMWTPRNYDGETRGQVPLWEALAKSYNLPVVRLGLDVGMRAVLNTVERLGLEAPRPAYPSLFLGAADYTPLEVAQMYHTLASGGFRSELRAVRAVMTADGRVLSRYPLVVERAFEPAPVYLVNFALQGAMWSGTGRSTANWLGPQPLVAGKTGTTDDTRDSWFAGFSGNLLGVVWLGRDDNGRTGLTGSSGALTVWSELFAATDWRPLQLTPPDGVEPLWVERSSGLLAAEHCVDAVALPYVRAYPPSASSSCVQERNLFERASDWFKGVL